MKNRVIRLSNIKVSVNSRYSSQDSYFFVKAAVGKNLQRTENVRKLSSQVYYQYQSIDIEWDPLDLSLEFEFLKEGSPYPTVLGESKVLIQTLEQADVQQLKLPLISNSTKIGWLYFQFCARSNHAKKQQLLFINSIAVQYHNFDTRENPVIFLHCGNLTKSTPTLTIINNRATFNQVIVLPVKFTGMITIEIRTSTLNIDPYYSSLYFMVESLRRGDNTEIRLPFSLYKSNKKIGQIIISYYLQNLYLPNKDNKSSFLNGSKNSRGSTPSTEVMDHKSVEQSLIDNENLLFEELIQRSMQAKYVRTDNNIYKFGMSQRHGNF